MYIYIYIISIIHLFSYFLMPNYAAAAPLGGVSALKPWKIRGVCLSKVGGPRCEKKTASHTWYELLVMAQAVGPSSTSAEKQLHTKNMTVTSCFKLSQDITEQN
jgi:hypothetical protein